MIIGGSESGKTNALLHLINGQNDTDKIYLYARDLSEYLNIWPKNIWSTNTFEYKYEYLIKKHEDAGIKHLNNWNAFIECSNTMDEVYENIND